MYQLLYSYIICMHNAGQELACRHLAIQDQVTTVQWNTNEYPL